MIHAFLFQVSLLWRRSIDDPYFMRVFCLAHAEKLSHQVCDTALGSLQELSQGRTGEIQFVVGWWSGTYMCVQYHYNGISIW